MTSAIDRRSEFQYSSREDAVQVFQPLTGSRYILGAVGVLQFDVTMARLKEEYGVDAVYEGVDYSAARWVGRDDRKKLEAFQARFEANLALDSEGRLSFLARSEWVLEDTMEQFLEVSFYKTREFN